MTDTEIIGAEENSPGRERLSNGGQLEAKPLECGSLLPPCNRSTIVRTGPTRSELRVDYGGSKLPHFHEKVGRVKAQSQ